MNKFKIFLVIIINLLLQITLLNRIKLFGVNPNMAIPIVVALALGFGAYTGGFSGLIMGLLEDILFGQVLGVKALIYFVIGFLIGNSEMGINKDDVRTGLILTAVSTVASFIMNVIIGSLLGNNIAVMAGLATTLMELILNSIIYLPVFYLFQKVFEFPRFRL